MSTLTQQIERLRVVTALRVMLVLVLCVLLAAVLDLETGIFVLLPALIMMFISHDESIRAGCQLIGGSLLGALFALAVIDLALEARPFYMVINLLAILGLAYWAAQGLRNRWPAPLAAVFAMFNITSSAFVSISAPDLGDAAAITWFFEVTLGVVVAWVALIGLWPSPTARDLDRLYDGIRRECAVLLREVARMVAHGEPVTYRPSPLSLKYFGDLGHQLDTLRWRLARSRPSHGELRERLVGLSHIYVNVRYMARSLEDLPGAGPRPETRTALVKVMTVLADRLDGASTEGFDQAHALIDARSRVLGADQEDLDSAHRLSVKLAAFLTSARAVVSDIDALSKPDPFARQAILRPAMASSHPYSLEPDSIKAALKMTLGVLIGLSVHLLTALPAGAFLVLALVIILVQPNLGKSHLKIRLWIPGVALGSLYSLLGLGLITTAPHFPLMLAWLALGFLVGGYICAGPDRVSYAGVQICLSIAVILVMGAFPITSVVSAEERVIGGILGFLIALGIAHLVWPEHPAKLLRASFAKNLRALPEALAAVCRTDEPDPAATRRDLVRLKLDVQSDFNLLYDFSYMLTKRVQPAYDYRAIAHAMGSLFVQVWSLHEALSEIHEPAQRRAVVEPLVRTHKRLREISGAIAAAIEQNAPDSRKTIAALEALAQELAQGPDQTPKHLRDEPRWREQFGLNVARELVHELTRIAASLETSRPVAVPTTVALARTYEGAG